MDRVQGETIRLWCPYLADVFVRRASTECHESSCTVVCWDKIGEVCAQLVVAVVMEALDSSIPDRAVHAIELTFDP